MNETQSAALAEAQARRINMLENAHGRASRLQAELLEVQAEIAELTVEIIDLAGGWREEGGAEGPAAKK